MKRLSKTKKWTAAELADLNAQGLLHAWEQALTGTRRPKPLFNEDTFEKICEETFAQNPESRERYAELQQVLFFAFRNCTILYDAQQAAKQIKTVLDVYIPDTENTAARKVAAEKAAAVIGKAAEELRGCLSEILAHNEIIKQAAGFYSFDRLNSFVIAENTLKDLLPPLEARAAELQQVACETGQKALQAACVLIVGLYAEMISHSYSDEKIDALTDKFLSPDAFKNPVQLLQILDCADRIHVTRIGTAKITTLKKPLNKGNRELFYNFDRLIKEDTDGQLSLRVNLAAESSKESADLIFSMTYQGSSRNVPGLTPYKDRIMMAAAALHKANGFFTLQQLFDKMGGHSVPSPQELEKLNRALTELSDTHIYLTDADAVQRMYKGKEVFTYDGMLLPMERITALINGRPVQAAIHLLREPPLISYAKSTGQITDITLDVLKSPLSLTDMNLRVENYLIEQIAHIKNSGKTKANLRIATLYEGAGAHTKKQRQRCIPDKVIPLLEHYKKIKFIKGYKIDTAAGHIELQLWKKK